MFPGEGILILTHHASRIKKIIQKGMEYIISSGLPGRLVLWGGFLRLGVIFLYQILSRFHDLGVTFLLLKLV